MMHHMARTYVILDGLQDLQLGQQLSKQWAAAGFDNGVDVAGQCAWLSPASSTQAALRGELTEEEVDKAAAIARRYGVEIRDRAGKSFIAENDLDALRDQVTYEYKCRFATGLVYGLPALALHYFAPFLAGNTADDPRSMSFPWFFEMLLSGWVCISAAWPIIWQGAVALRFRRLTADLLSMLLIAAAFLPSAVAVLAMAFVADPWLSTPATGGTGPMFHATVYLVLLAVLNRWLAHRATAATSGWADLLPRPFPLLIGCWLLGSAIVSATLGWPMGLAVGLLFSPMIGLACVNALNPGWLTVFPMVGCAFVLLAGPRMMNMSIAPYEIELAFTFGVIMALTYTVGWRRLSAQKQLRDITV